MTIESDTVDWDFVLEKIENGAVPQEFCSGYYADMPDTPAMIERKARTDSAFAARLKDAKQLGAIAMLAECKQIADDQSMRADQKKIAIDVRMKLAAIWNPNDCREVSKTETVTTVRNQTPRDAYIADCVSMLGLSPAQAAAEYDARAGATMQ
jgi:hypothetical protein